MKFSKKYSRLLPTKIAPLLFIAFAISCVPTNKITEVEQTKVLLTNLVDEVNITGEGTFVDESNNLTITVKPFDVRQFDWELYQNDGGEHKSVLASLNEVKHEEVEKFSKDREILVSKLIDEGISPPNIRSITEIVFGDEQNFNNPFIYSDPNIYVTSNIKVNELNPFAVDGRYLTVVEVKMENNSNEIKKICSNEFLITTNDFSYSNISANDLLKNHPLGTKRHEILHKLLIKECEILPKNTTITAYLVFPSFYDKETISFHYLKVNQSFKEDFTIQRRRVNNQYIFSEIRVAGTRTSGKGYRIITDSEPTISERAYHFIKIKDSINFVGNEGFLIHEDIDLNTVQVFTVKYKPNEYIDIFKSNITKQEIKNGLIEQKNKLGL